MFSSKNKFYFDNHYALTFFKSLILTIILMHLFYHTQAQTIFEEPVLFESSGGEHDGNMGGKSVDMDGDGDLDIVFMNEGFFLPSNVGSFVHIKINDGFGDFTAEYRVLTANLPNDFDIGDLNNDGLPDLAIITRNQSLLEVALNTSTNGDLSFGTVSSQIIPDVRGVVISNINGDANNDLVLSTLDGPELYYGDGTGGNWSVNVELSNTLTTGFTLVSDLNGDDILDIVTTRPGTNSNNTFFFKGDSLPDGSQSGTFQAAVTFTGGPSYHKFIIADFNNDGHADLITQSLTSHNFNILLNNGDGSGVGFNSVATPSAGSFDRSFTVGDMNNDSYLDLVATVPSGSGAVSSKVYIYNNNGNGTLQAVDTYDYESSSSFPFEVAATTGDYDGDGLTDMAAIDNGAHVFITNQKALLEIDQGGATIERGGDYDFGYISAETSSNEITFTITNNGGIDAVLSGTPIIQLSGPYAAMFSVDQTGTSTTILPNGSTNFTVSFNPSASNEGENTALLIITSNELTSPYTINLTGTTHLVPDGVTVSASPVCLGEEITLTETNGIIGPGEQWVWYSGSCGGTQVGIGESINVVPTASTSYYVRAETIAGVALTPCASGQVIISGEIVSLTTSSNQINTMEGEDQTINITATGTAPTFQWQKDGVDLVDGGDISGSQTDAITITTLEEGDEAVYTCVVSNFCSQESININLAVLQLPPSDICGTVLNFDGIDDYVTLGNQINPSSITFEAWIYLNQIDASMPIISKAHRTFDGLNSFHVELDPNNFIVSTKVGASTGSNTVSASVNWETNRWYHIAVTYDGTNRKLYLDGILFGTSSHPGGLRSSTNYMRLGGIPWDNFPHVYSNLKMDEVRIWDIARTQSELISTMTSALSGNESNLIAYWDLDDGIGSTMAIDKSGSGYDAALRNMDPSTSWQSLDGVIDDDATAITVAECQQYVSPSGNFTWTSSGTYLDTLQTTLGCDSIITVNLTIEKFDQLISFNALADMTYGDANISLSATSDSGLPVSYSSSDLNVATISGNTLTVIGGGTATITASQAGDACYNVAPDELQVLTVNKLTLTATASDLSKVYGDVNPTLTTTYSGFLNGDDVSAIDTPPTISTPADVTSDAGDYVISLSGGLDNGYDFVFVDGVLEITKRNLFFVANPVSQTYGATVPLNGFDFSTAAFVNGDDENELDVLPTLATPVTPTSPAGGFYVMTVSGGSDNNYNLMPFGNQHAVNPAPLTITADDLTKAIGTANPALTLTYSGFVNGEDASVLTSFPVASTTATMSSPIGSYPITLNGGTADNYTITLQNGTLNVISAVPLTITADVQTKTYGDSDPVFSYQLTSGTLLGGDSFTGNLSRLSGEDVGNYAIEIGTLTAGPGYVITLVSNDLTILPKPITITADANQSKVYGEADPIFTSSITTGSLESGDALTGSLVRVTGENVGNYNIGQGTLSAGSNYAITYVADNFEIVAKPLTVTADASQSKVYGEPDPVFTSSITTGSLASGDVLTGNLDRVIGENVGTYAIVRGTLSAGSNYNITFIPNDFTVTTKQITVGAINEEKVYGEPDPVYFVNVISGSLESGDSFSGSFDRVSGEDVGAYPISMGTFTAGPNYDITFVPNNLDIIQRPLSISPNFGQSKIYGQSDPILSYTLLGTLVSGDILTGNLDRQPGENVGTYSIEPGTLTAGLNYILTFGNSDFSITPKPITITTGASQSKTYGDTDPVFTHTITTGSLEPGDILTGNLDRVTGENVGNYAINQGSLSADSNYTITFISNDFEITTKQITVGAINEEKVYGEPDPVYFVNVISGSLESGDSFSGSFDRVSGEDVGAYSISMGTFTAGPNYDITFVTNNLDIIQRSLSISPNFGQGKIYGQSDPILSYALLGTLVSGDILTGKLGRQPGENVGTYSIEPGTLTAGLNYILTFGNSDFSITSKPITVTVDISQNKTYGDIDPVFTHTITTGSLEPGDVLTGSLDRVTGENVGNYAIEQGTLDAGTNYSLSFVSNDFTIAPKALIVTADAQQTKVYGQPDPVLAYSISSGSLESGDSFTGVLDRASGENVGNYTIDQGTLNAGNNYTLSFLSNDFSITKKAITVTVDPGQTKIYGVSDPIFTYALTGSLESGDSFTGALDRLIGENVGAYTIVQGTLNAGNNYMITFEPDDLTITPKPLTINSNFHNKVYGQPDPLLTFSISSGSLEAGDVFSGSVGRTPGEDVGFYNTTRGTLTAGSNYTITFVPTAFIITEAILNIEVNPGQSKIYGVIDPAFTYSIVSGALISGDQLTGTLGRVGGEDVGTYAVDQGTLTAGSNYIILFSDDDFEITPKPITITANASQTKVYGTSDPGAFTYSQTGTLESGDTFTGVLDRAIGENVGNYAINQGTLTAGSNYDITYQSANFVITPKPITVTADASQTKVYGTSDTGAFTYSQTGTLESGDSFTGVLDRALGENVGNYTINQGTLTAGGNYTITYQSADFNITPAPLSATADNQIRLFGVANPSLTIDYSGFVNGDNAASITEPNIATTATISSNVGIYPITLTGGNASNYTLNLTDGTLTINQASQTITFGALPDKTQGDADFSLTATTSSGLMISYSSSNTAVATVSGNTVTLLGAGATTITASQPGDMNYTPATPVDQTFTVDPLYIWNGTAWNNSSAPSSVDNAMINGDYTFSTNGLFEANDLTINSGVVLTVDGENTLTVNGDINNVGNVHVTSGSSLVTLGNVTGTGYQIDRVTTFDANTGRYSIVGAPVVSAGFSVLGSNALVYGYDQTEVYNPFGNAGLDRFKTPIQLSESIMGVGSGYFSAFSGDVNGLIAFSGTPNSGIINVALDHTNHPTSGTTPDEDDFEGFNLVSNPYPSAIDFNALMGANAGTDINGSIYLWDDNNSNVSRGDNADYIIVNAMGNTDSRSSGLAKWDGFIRSGQGFFVKANSATALVFNNTMRVAGNNTDGGFYRTTPVSNAIKLLLSDEVSQRAAVVGFANDASIGHDRDFDALSLSGGNLQLYSLQVDGGKPLGIQGLPVGFSEQIQLGYKASGAETYTISIANLDELVDMEVVLLKDHLTGTTVNLKEEAYTFATQASLDETRFTLQVASSVISSIDQLDQEVFYTYSIKGQLKVVFQTVGFENADFKLIDLTGQTIFEQSTQVQSNKWNMDTRKFPEGIYVLMIKTEYGVWKKRVITK